MRVSNLEHHRDPASSGMWRGWAERPVRGKRLLSKSREGTVMTLMARALALLLLPLLLMQAGEV